MRLLHVSDTHVGLATYNKLTPEGLNQREQDFFDAFRQAIDVALRERVDAVLHSGDLFDSVRPTNRAIGHVLAEVLRLHEARIPFVVISGNHEAPRLRETGAVLRLLEFIPGVRAAYKGKLETVRLGDLAVHCVPHAASAEALVEELRRVRRDDVARWHVAMLHAGVLGVGDFRTGEFNEQVVPQNELPQDMDYVALGHYHRAVEVAPRAWYAGSTERCSFRECGETKSVNLVDLATGRVEPRPLATRPMVDLPTLSCEGVDEAAIAPALRARLAEARLEGAIARLRVTGVPAHVYATLDLERVRRATAAALHFDLQVEVSSTGGSGAAAAPLRTLDEELEAFLSARPLQGADRDELLATAREILAEAAAP